MQVEVKTVTIQLGKKRVTFYAHEARQIGEMLQHILQNKINVAGVNRFVYTERPFPTQHPDFDFELNDGKTVIKVKEPVFPEDKTNA